MNQNISERKEILQELEETKVRLATLEHTLGSLQDMVCVFDLEGRFTFANTSMLNFLRLTDHQINGKNFQDLLHPTLFSDTWHHQMAKAIATGQVTKGKTVCTESSGLTSFYDYTLTPIFNQNAEITSVSNLMKDASEQHEFEKICVEKDRLYELIMQAPALIFIIHGPEHIFTLVNPPMQKLLGKRPLLERPFAEALPELVAQGYLQILDHVYATDTPFVGKEISIKMSRDENVPIVDGFFNIIFSPIKDKHLKVNGIYCFASEVTPLVESKLKFKQLNLVLSEKNQELLQINSDLDNFVYTASHDLKAPVSNIEGLIDALSNEMEKDEVDKSVKGKMIDLIRESILQFKNTISDLTEISYIQRNTEEDISETKIEEIFEQVKILIKDQINISKAEIRLTFECPTIRFSSRNFQSVLYNLLSNAIKYRSSERTPVIQIHCSESEDKVMLEVKDNGLGIPSDQMENIFKMYKRAHQHVEGSGIGLYLVKRIIENIGGKIEVDSQLGVGSTFRIYIPIANNGKKKGAE